MPYKPRGVPKRLLAVLTKPKFDDPVPVIELEPDVVQLMLDNYYNDIPPERGLFISIHDNPPKFTAIDNSTGDMWMEDFDDRFQAERWLIKEK